MKISIIIPLYNKEHYILGTINSVLEQTFQDWEAIVIDDGSTDRSAEIVQSIQDTRIKFLKQSNQGVSITRNRGIDIASGEYIAFLDADDQWMPNYLTTMYSMAKKFPNYKVFCSAQKGRPIKTLPKGISIIDNFCAYDYVFWTGCLLIKKEVFKQVGGFREGIQLGEDSDMWLRIACKYSSVYLNEELVNHPYITENNLARTVDTKKSFPYWEWYNYPYFDKRSLFKYTTEQIIRCAKDLAKQKRYSDAWFFLRRTKGFTAIRPRLKLLISIIFRK